METATTAPRRATVMNLKVSKILDQDVDLSYLDQYEKCKDKEEQEYYKKDQRRKSRYGSQWCMYGIRAQVEIGIPSENGKYITTQKLTSGGLWGIESDSGKQYFKEVAQQELEDLKDMLQVLNVDLSGFEALAKGIEPQID